MKKLLDAKLCPRFESLGKEAFGYMDNVCLAFADLTTAVIKASPFLKREVMDIGVAVNETETLHCRLDEIPRQQVLRSSGASALPFSLRMGRLSSASK